MGGSAAALAVLALGGAVGLMWTPGWTSRGLSAPARGLWRAVAEAVLDGVLPTAADARAAALQGHLARLERTIEGLSPGARKELSDLLALLCLAPGRRMLTGLPADWAELAAPDVQNALQAMRTGERLMGRQIYQALRDLTNAAWFSEPATWSALGYPGPRAIG